MAATPGLSGEAAQRIDAELLATLAEVQRAGRRTSEQRGAVRRRLFVAHAAWIEQVMAGRLDAAVVALDWPLGDSAMRAAIAALRIPVAAYDQAERRGVKRTETVLRKAKILPAPFATNPAQAFFALQRLVAERRRQAADGDHLSPDDAVSMAA